MRRGTSLSLMISIGFLLLPVCSLGQQEQKELAPAVDKAISPLPPSHIAAKATNLGVRISWHFNPLATDAKFKIYRLSGHAKTEIAVVDGYSYVDRKPLTGKVLYQVSTVNGYGTESTPSASVAPDPNKH